jgi:hypothetical protein
MGDLAPCCPIPDKKGLRLEGMAGERAVHSADKYSPLKDALKSEDTPDKVDEVSGQSVHLPNVLEVSSNLRTLPQPCPEKRLHKIVQPFASSQFSNFPISSSRKSRAANTVSVMTAGFDAHSAIFSFAMIRSIVASSS